MATYVGGLRSRLISDSFYEMIRASLTALGWFDSGRQHSPIILVRGDVSWDNPTSINTLAVSNIDINADYMELGSNYMEERWSVYVDFYAESDSLGTHMAGDIRDILRGKMPSIGRSQPLFEVLDYTNVVNPGDSPAFLFNVEIEQVTLDRAHNASRPWQRHFFSVSAELIDDYGDENDA